MATDTNNHTMVDAPAGVDILEAKPVGGSNSDSTSQVVPPPARVTPTAITPGPADEASVSGWKKVTDPLETIARQMILEALKPKRKIKKEPIRGRSKGPMHVPVGYLKNPELENYDDEEVKFYKRQDHKTKASIADMERTVKKINTNEVPTRFKILMSDIDVKAKAIAIQKYDTLCTMEPGSGDYHKLHNWTNAVSRIPFGINKPMPVSVDSPKVAVREFLMRTRERLDTKVYGHRDAKDHLIRLLAQWVSNPSAKGLVLGIQGSMGVGKTCLVKEGVCGALDIPFAFVPLGGVSDGCYLEGHSYTYEGSTWGKVVDLLMRAGCMNPVIFFDEVDKISNTHKGDEIVNILMHMTDATQNDKFHDKFFTDFEFDLSRSIMIFTYNNEEAINPILRDRMIKIRTQGYTLTDKLEIAKKHMLPEVMREFNILSGQINFSDSLLRCIIEKCDKEEGVRNFKRALHDVVSNLHYEALISEKEIVFPINVTEKMVHKYVNVGKEMTTSHHMMYI